MAISGQPTVGGRYLNVAATHTPDGHLLLPYGDYGANTGPIDVIGYRPSDGDVVTYFDNLTDERIENYRTLNSGRIWTCATDPQGRDEAKVARSSNAGAAPWSAVTIAVAGKGVAIHLFDIAQTSNGDLYACGSRNYTAAEHASQPNPNPDDEYNGAAFVWKSTDGGTSWTEDFVDLKDGDGYYRFYGFGRIGDDLFVAASDGTGYWQKHAGVWSAKKRPADGHPQLYIYSPCVWSQDGTQFATSSNSNVVFELDGSGELVMTSPSLGINRVLAAGPNGWLCLSNARNLWYGDQLLGQLPAGPYYRGCVMAGQVYVSDGTHIYRAELPSA